MKDALITGLHRSGTTLICHLINKLPNAVALDEPLCIDRLINASDEAIIRDITFFFAEQREEILSTGWATSKSTDGVVGSNHLSDVVCNGTRQSLVNGNRLQVANIANASFDLFVKHPAFFTAMLSRLEKNFCCYANIRNPLAVLLSWRTANFNVSNGRAPVAEKMNPELKRRLDAEQDVLGRQLVLLDFFYQCYADCSSTTIVRYEDVVATSGRILATLNRRACYFNVPLSSRNTREIRPTENVFRISERLLNSSNSCWLFYSQDDVCELLKPISIECVKREREIPAVAVDETDIGVTGGD